MLYNYTVDGIPRKLQHNQNRTEIEKEKKACEKLELSEQLEENHSWMQKQKNVRSRSAQS